MVSALLKIALANPFPSLQPFRAPRFGLDCADRLEWRGWQPGGEYECTLLIRNASTRTVTLRYRLPSSKVFSMAFPEAVKLVAGMSFGAKVTFRPVALQPYEERVLVSVGREAFWVAVAALTPATRLEMPRQIDFGFCAVNEVRTGVWGVVSCA